MTPKPSASDDDSVTEEEPEEDYAATGEKGKVTVHDHLNVRVRSSSPARSTLSKRATPDQSPAPKSRESTKQSPSPPSSSPLPAAKKAKKAKAIESSSDEGDSEEERKKRLARLKGRGGASSVKQPLKRGGRRF